MIEKNKQVAIIVVTYNRITLLKEVICALRRQTYTNNKIIVVNNGSTDETLSWLEEQNDIYTITQSNLGGAGGFHTGMKYAAENGFDYCWIMDDDVICHPDALEQLCSSYSKKRNIGFVCSKVLGISGEPMNTPRVDQRIGENGYFDYSDLIDYKMIKVESATFVSVFLSTNIIFEVGLPYKDFFIWGDDTEYTKRISSKYDSYLSCNSIVVHKRAQQTSLKFINELDENRLNNYFYYFRNNGYVKCLYENVNKKKYAIKKMKNALKMMLKGDLRHGKIMFKAYLALYHFAPQIVFPQKNN